MIVVVVVVAVCGSGSVDVDGWSSRPPLFTWHARTSSEAPAAGEGSGGSQAAAAGALNVRFGVTGKMDVQEARSRESEEAQKDAGTCVVCSWGNNDSVV